MEERAKKNHIGFEIRLIHNLIDEAVRAYQEEDGLRVTQLQHWIIRYLNQNRDRDVYQRDLEEEFCTSRATISNTLQVMERNGLITRTSVKQDARLKKLCLTERSIEFSRHARQHVDQMELLLRKGMTEEEFQTFMALLRRVRHNLEENRQRGSQAAADMKQEEGSH